MKGFTPIAMKCTQEQFEAIRPKLKGFEFRYIGNFNFCDYLINNLNGNSNMISNISKSHKMKHNRAVYEEWNEEIFLSACGIYVETLQEKQTRLTNELNEVNRLIEEENKPKVGDWVIDGDIFYKLKDDLCFDKLKKITDRDLIKKLNELIK